MAQADVLTPAGEVRTRQGTFPNTGSGDASEQEGGRWQDLLRNEVQQGQQGSGVLAVRLHDDGLKVEEIETPSPDPGEVLVRVHAAAITRGELEWPVDRLPAIPSYELSGVVVGTGDEVYALTPFDRDGVAAEYAVVPADVLAPKPLRLSHVEAAALPMGGLTAWQALFVHGRLARGERVLVTGASGGVGHIAVQLARHAGAAVVESGPVDLVFDTRGGEVPAGERVVTIAEEMPGAIYFIVEPDHEQLLELRTLVDAGELRAEVDSVFPLTEARAAFERVAGRGKRGKVVLEVGAD
jgi:NADPH:quinone reductase-like Zn-dependent oxidoreductase